MDKTLGTLMNILDQSISDAHTRDGDSITIPEGALTITPSVISTNMQPGHGAAAHILYQLHSPLLGEDILEAASGIGTDEAEALHRSAASFLLGILCAFRHLARNEYAHRLSGTFAGREYHWNVAESCGAVLKGKSLPNPPDGSGPLWDIIREKLPDYLGSRSLYWVKTFIAKQADGEVTAELRINDIVIHDLSDLLADYAAGIDNGGRLYTCKDIFFLRQDGESCYPYTIQQIHQAVDTALGIFETYLQDDVNERFRIMSEALGDTMLADELCAWIPELCAEMNWDTIRYSDFFKLSIGEGSEPFTVARTQFTAYPWVVPYLHDCFSEGRRSVDLYKKLIYESATGSAILQAIQDGNQDFSGATFAPLHFEMKADYQVR